MGALFVGGMLGSIIAIIIIAFLVSALFIWIGASWANVVSGGLKVYYLWRFENVGP